MIKINKSRWNLEILNRKTVFGKALSMWYAVSIFELIYSILIYLIYFIIQLSIHIPFTIINAELISWLILIIPYLIISNFGIFIGAILYYGLIRRLW